MRIHKYHIRNRIFRFILTLGAMTHIRHWRGHGVHSPYTYSLIRNVFMKKKIQGEDHTIYDQMRKEGLPEKGSIQLQNLHSYCGEHRFSIVLRNDPADPLTVPAGEKAILCVLYPRQNRARVRRCRQMIREHKGLSIDNRRYMLFFYDNRLTKMHYKL